MNTIARKLPVFVLMAAALTTALTIGPTTTLAVSNTHQLQLMGNDDSLASTSNEFGDFNSAQYAWSHPYHHSSTDMIADFNGDNSNSTASSDYRGGFNSAQYGVQPHHHHSSTDMISNFNNDNSTGNVGSDGFADLNSAQYGVQPHHHHSSTDMINNDNLTGNSSSDSHSRHHQNSTPNSSWMWPTQHSAPDIVDLN
jgi:hypothetical protein